MGKFTCKLTLEILNFTAAIDLNNMASFSDHTEIQTQGLGVKCDISVTLIAHITYVRKENICNRDIFSSLFIGAPLKGKNSLLLGANSLL